MYLQFISLLAPQTLKSFSYYYIYLVTTQHKLYQLLHQTSWLVWGTLFITITTYVQSCKPWLTTKEGGMGHFLLKKKTWRPLHKHGTSILRLDQIDNTMLNQHLLCNIRRACLCEQATCDNLPTNLLIPFMSISLSHVHMPSYKYQYEIPWREGTCHTAHLLTPTSSSLQHFINSRYTWTTQFISKWFA